MEGQRVGGALSLQQNCHLAQGMGAQRLFNVLHSASSQLGDLVFLPAVPASLFFCFCFCFKCRKNDTPFIELIGEGDERTPGHTVLIFKVFGS